MSTFELYLLLTLPAFKTTLLILSGIGLGGLLISAFICCCMAGDSHDVTTKANHMARAKAFARWAPVPVVSLLLAALLPSMKVVLALVAWEMGTGIEGIETLPESMVEYLNKLIESELRDLTAEPE